MQRRYIHDTIIHNTKAAEIIVPEIIKIFRPKSVVDVGCGTATWLSVFESNGIIDLLGIDGSYLDRNMLLIDEKKFITRDLIFPFSIERKFDIAISLEVAEHLPESSADSFIRSLTALSDTIIFSAAIPGQGGQNHLNEQFPAYWRDKIARYNYHLIDDFSDTFWNDNTIEWWYRQNIYVYQKKNFQQNEIDLKLRIHPELYKIKLMEIELLKRTVLNIYQGKISTMQALKILLKSVASRFKK